MTSNSTRKLSYQMLRPETRSDDERERMALRSKSWSRFRKIPIRKRFTMEAKGEAFLCY
ncbi:hypothetical protein Lalb_Chr02g0158131 [Lupinus albus]|uniref:Uncharacterized protein n=1 Tax=Lupinus albus TaxID=3870 RepID=A0A6A4R1K8_LUPAL|nr:hypothetical protein Lalb_Chr02g0158131 [Lupinus albus]